MASAKKNPRTINEERLWQLAVKYPDNQILQARLEYTDAESISRYVRPLDGQESIRPRILPTAQVSGRWSTSGVPRTNWPRHDPAACGCNPESYCPRAVRDIVGPWPGTWWYKGDAEAIEARLAAAYLRDEEDLAAFAKGWDLHTLTACSMFNLPQPPEKTKKGIAADKDWQAGVKWGGGEDRRRSLAKTFRYATLYSVSDQAVLQNKEVVKLGLPRAEIIQYAKMYKAGKPVFFAARDLRMALLADQGWSRTFLGRLRRLYGDFKSRGKDGWNHQNQGSVSDIVNQIVGRAAKAFPEMQLISNMYDGLELSFPESTPVDRVADRMREICEEPRNVDGVLIILPWEWKVIHGQD